jgi:hypothetical protein
MKLLTGLFHRMLLSITGAADMWTAFRRAIPFVA